MSGIFEQECKMSSWDLANVVHHGLMFTSPFVTFGEFIESHFTVNRRDDNLVFRSELELKNGHPLLNLSSARCSLDLTFKYVSNYENRRIVSRRSPSRHDVIGGTVFWEYDTIIPASYFEDITFERYSELEIKLQIALNPAADVEMANSEFSTKLNADLSTLLQKGDFSDIVLVSSDGHEFRAHRNILSARSSVFAAMFATDMKEKNENRAVLENMDADLLKSVLKFVYSGTLDGQPEGRSGFHEELFGIADQYALDDLRVAILSAIQVDKDNYGKLLILADRHGDNNLRSRILDFIASNCSELKKRGNSL